jgi:hypothetical protein
MYETKQETPLARPSFWRRLFRHAAVAIGLILVSLAIGMAGYCGFEHMGPLDGFLNSAMLLGGMGPVNPPFTPAGKLFAGLFALYAGPGVHRHRSIVVHAATAPADARFHWPEK